MFCFCGYNGFKQISSFIGKNRPRLTSDKNEETTALVVNDEGLYPRMFNTFHKIATGEDTLKNRPRVLVSWSYILSYSKQEMDLFGYLDGQCGYFNIPRIPKSCEIYQVCCNRGIVLCVTEDGDLWKYNLSNQTWSNASSSFFTELSADSCDKVKIVKACCGDTVTVILTNQGNVYSISNKLNPPGVRMKEVTCGKSHVVMLSEGGNLYCAGEGSRGQLGTGELEDSEVGVLVDELAGLRVVSVACGGWHTCAVTADGDLYTWGWNMCGQLGLQTTGSEKVSVQAAPQLIDWPKQPQSNIVKVACGARHTVVLLGDGSVWGCGWNAYGQLALPGVENVNCMTRLFSPQDKTQDVICGPWNTCLFV